MQRGLGSCEPQGRASLGTRVFYHKQSSLSNGLTDISLYTIGTYEIVEKLTIATEMNLVALVNTKNPGLNTGV